ncbi:Uncharacterised protein [Vibrio cholerae]|nr:Uncharacterised protein [Vibrio cholerae]CSC72062.1 Uncharacterised protein [Vibrio cholerae]CSC93540.1 Uncharacterised protein [Vibrio cholerae]CSH86783.1 Uncharacterised protein [Vibrio cholerae]
MVGAYLPTAVKLLKNFLLLILLNTNPIIPHINTHLPGGDSAHPENHFAVRVITKRISQEILDYSAQQFGI